MHKSLKMQNTRKAQHFMLSTPPCDSEQSCSNSIINISDLPIYWISMTLFILQEYLVLKKGPLCLCLRRAKNGGVSGYMGCINHPWRRIYRRGAVSAMSAVRQTATWQPWPKWGWGGRDDRTESHETGRTELTRFEGSWAAQRTDRYTTYSASQMLLHWWGRS